MLKRPFDIMVSAVGLAATALPLTLLALLVRLDSPGPALHRAVRVGRDGAVFTLYKLRTMVVETASPALAITSSGDPRVTRIGRWLRRTKLDEIPQLINVLKGEMSVVGPRPEDPLYVDGYTAEQRGVLRVRPGLTSPATVAHRHEEALLAAAGGDIERVYLETILPSKLQLDLAYLERQTFLVDLAVIWHTIRALTFRSLSPDPVA